jgi:hypothetical protein
VSIEPTTAHGELSAETIKTRTISGVLALTGRTSFLQLVGLPANFLLSIFLTTAEFGTFGVVAALLGFIAYFSNVGIAAALIQKKETPTKKRTDIHFYCPTISSTFYNNRNLYCYPVDKKLATFNNRRSLSSMGHGGIVAFLVSKNNSSNLA